ncbi:hypothetical protein FWH13_00020 [Candidatus Saccharibacteria bacterium]|nr:hypothetical protein [Candidatus Saccharibacteria bacterium]
MYQRLYYARPVTRTKRRKALLFVLAVPAVILASYVAAIAIDISSTSAAPVIINQ